MLNVRGVDVFEFVRLAREAEGDLALSTLLRFCEGLPSQPVGEAGKVHWSLRGYLGARGEPLLDLRVQAQPLLQCQRCLQPFAWPVDTTSTLQLVRSESELDQGGTLDEEEIDAPEKVVGSQRFDLQAQVEDELILSVPYIPKHDVCPGVPGAQEPEEPEAEGKPSPFAVLGKLKSGK